MRNGQEPSQAIGPWQRRARRRMSSCDYSMHFLGLQGSGLVATTVGAIPLGMPD